MYFFCADDRPYIDCSTTTPMTGTGLVKFERFTALNKLPWDDVNDQLVVQEPGVYAVFVTAVLQDAVLAVKIASNLLEREVFTVGSRQESQAGGAVDCEGCVQAGAGGLLNPDLRQSGRSAPGMLVWILIEKLYLCRSMMMRTWRRLF